MRRHSRGRRGRRQLGGPGSGFPFQACRPGHHGRPRAGAGRVHVALPHRPDRADSERGRHARRRGTRAAGRPGARGRRRRGPADRSAAHPGGGCPVRLRRRDPLHRLARGSRRTGRRWLRANRKRRGARARRFAGIRGRLAAPDAGNERAGRLRGGRRPQWLGQAGGRGGRRGGDGDPARHGENPVGVRRKEPRHGEAFAHFAA